MLNALCNWIKSFFVFDVDNDSLSKRMENAVDSFNNQSIHCYKPFVVSINSKKILKNLKLKTSFDEKVVQFSEHYEQMNKVTSELYNYFAPTFMYYFNNEIHLVFYPDENGNYMFNGNVHKIMTSIVSHATFVATKMNMDCVFTGTYLEFSKEYETMNYIIWRQFDCYRNTMTLLHKCVSDEDLQNKSIDEIENTLSEHHSIPNIIKYGVVLKKEMCIKPCETDLQHPKYRRELKLFSYNLSDDFKTSMRKFLLRKVL